MNSHEIKLALIDMEINKIINKKSFLNFTLTKLYEERKNLICELKEMEESVCSHKEMFFDD